MTDHPSNRNDGRIAFWGIDFRLIVSVLIAVIVLAVYRPVYHYGFVPYDDDVNLSANPYLNPVSLEHTKQFWLGQYRKLYIPLTYTLWSFLTWLAPTVPEAGASAKFVPQVFHTVNIVLHLFNALLVRSLLVLILQTVSKKRNMEREEANRLKTEIAAGLGALFFALHPVQVESVAWATEMKTQLSAFFSLISMHQYFLYSMSAEKISPSGNRFKNLHYAAATAAFILAMLAKPSAAAVPIIAFLLGWLVVNRSFKAVGLSVAGWVVVTLIIAAITKSFQPDTELFLVIPFWQKFLVAGYVFDFYLFKLVFPLHLGIDYGKTPAVILQKWWIYLAPLVPIMLAVGIRLLKNRLIWYVSFGIFIAGILPVMGFVPFTFQNTSTVADRYLYMPMLGPALLFSWLFINAKRKTAIPVFIIVLALFAGLTIKQSAVWKNGETLFTNALKVNPRSDVAENNFGRYLQQKGKIKEAKEHYLKAIALKPASENPYANLGGLYYKQGDFDNAERFFHKALERNPNNVDSYDNMGSVLTRKGNFEGAIYHYRKAIELAPDKAIIYRNLGAVLQHQGKIDEAIANFRKALELEPASVSGYVQMGGALSAKGEFEEAVSYYRQAIEIQPKFPLPYILLANIFQKQGEMKKAVHFYGQALRIQPNLRGIPETLKKLKEKTGNPANGG